MDKNQETDQKNSYSGPEGCFVRPGIQKPSECAWECRVFIQHSGKDGVN